MNLTAKKPDEAGTKVQAGKENGFRRFLRWTLRGMMVVVAIVLLVFVILFFRMDFPNQIHVAEIPWNTTFFSRLQGNHRVRDGSEEANRTPMIIGHRGSGLQSTSSKYTKIGNTEEAIRRAISNHIKWIEIDIQITKDHELVVFHDTSLGDKTDCRDEWHSSRVCNLNWKELATLHLNVEPQERIQRLKAVFDKFDHPDLKWILDIKPENDVGYDLLKRDKLDGLLQRLGPERVVIFGTYDILQIYRQPGGTFAEYDCGLVVQGRSFWKLLFNREQILTQCKQLNARYCVIPGMFAETSFIQLLNENDLEVLVFDCENLVDQKNFVARGVHGLIVDNPKATMANWPTKIPED